MAEYLPYVVTASAIGLSLVYGWRYISCERTRDHKLLSYNSEQYGHILRKAWTQHCVFINNRPVVLLGGEFHYWRVPDRDRWRPLLEQYKAAGLNCIRIYFHFGYHSPAEGKFIFDGNRDLEYLLDLCEQLDLFLIAAPGPYICAETSGGGFPAWMASKPSMRVRHALISLAKIYDLGFMNDCKSWMDQIIPILARHQITTKPNGCVIAVQIENELLPMPFISLLPFPYDKYMQELAFMARASGCTVPIFHNDPMLLGNFNPGKGHHAMDMYSFDRYIILPPVRNQAQLQWKDAEFANGIDSTETRTRSFGGGAANGPIFVAELQGGWFHQHGSKGSYDGIYNYFGEAYTQNVVQSFLAQGATMLSLYMFYGGTNWGSIGDPDVYTSYDYSASIREYGYHSGRLRHLRLCALFVQAFNDQLAQTNRSKTRQIGCSVDGILHMERESITDGTIFAFLRNFNTQKQTKFGLSLSTATGTIGPLPVVLAYRESFIAVANHTLAQGGPRIILATVPIVGKGYVDDQIVLIVIATGGAIIFGEVDASSVQTHGKVSMSSSDVPNTVTIQLDGRGSSEMRSKANEKLSVVIVAISAAEALTLTVNLTTDSKAELTAAWGAYHLLLQQHKHEDKLRMLVKANEDCVVHVLAGGRVPSAAAAGGFEQANKAVWGLRNWMVERRFGQQAASTQVGSTVNVGPWQEATYDWNKLPWNNISYNQRNPLLHKYTSGHVIYRGHFVWDERRALVLKLNIRHRVSIWLNGHHIGGHLSYRSVWEDVQSWGAALAFIHNFPLIGASSNGSDNWMLGGVTYDLSKALIKGQNELIILTESFGLNRQTMASNDIRNPRGILYAAFKPHVNVNWAIAGVDVTTLSDPFATFGMPLEQLFLTPRDQHNTEVKWKEEATSHLILRPDDGVVWLRTTFDRPFGTAQEGVGQLACPLHVSFEGQNAAYIWVNSFPIGRYHGDLGPQRHFYVMDGLLKQSGNELVIMAYTNVETEMKVQLAPYRVDHPSGNINDKSGSIFFYERHELII